MRKVLAQFVLLGALLGVGLGYAQSNDVRPSNLEPPPARRPQVNTTPTTPPPPEAPLVQLPPIDWSDKATYLKLALLVGSVILAKRAFKQMTDDY